MGDVAECERAGGLPDEEHRAEDTDDGGTTWSRSIDGLPLLSRRPAGGRVARF